MLILKNKETNQHYMLVFKEPIHGSTNMYNMMLIDLENGQMLFAKNCTISDETFISWQSVSKADEKCSE